MGTDTNDLKLNIANGALVIFFIYIAVNPGRGVMQAIIGGMFA